MTTKEARKLWIDALRSGEYQQGTGALQCGENTYCCLGVACVIAEQHGVCTFRYAAGHPLIGGVLRDPVMEWLGIRDNTGSYKVDGSFTCLVTQNDSYGKSFAEIAAIIESEPEGLFVD